MYQNLTRVANPFHCAQNIRCQVLKNNYAKMWPKQLRCAKYERLYGCHDMKLTSH